MNKTPTRLILIMVVVVLGIAGVVWFLESLNDGSKAGGEPTLQTAPEVPASAGFTRANGPREFTFPADHGSHPDFQTEWWYYTGNLQTADGRHFGYQLTFFRRALNPPDQFIPTASDWRTNP